MNNPACQTFLELLSGYIDTELSPADRTLVERHMAACPECTLRAADLRAESALVRVGLDILADDADFKDFSNKVMARVTPERPPVWERLSLWLSETYTYQRGTLVTVMATAAVVLTVATPLILRGRVPLGYARERLEIQAVTIDDAQQLQVKPVVLETETGDAIIFLSEPPVIPDGDEEHEEEVGVDPAPAKIPTGGEL